MHKPKKSWWTKIENTICFYQGQKKGNADGPNSPQDTGVEFLNRIKDHSAYFYKKLHSCKKHKKYDISYLIEQHGYII